VYVQTDKWIMAHLGITAFNFWQWIVIECFNVDS